jgi:hypothetical protein
MNKMLIATLLCAGVVTVQAEPSVVDQMVVTAVPRKPVLTQDILADVKQAPSAIVPTIELPPLTLTRLTPVPEGG